MLLRQLLKVIPPKSQGNDLSLIFLLSKLSEGKFNAILTWAPDRLSRNAGDLGRIVDLMDQENSRKLRLILNHLLITPTKSFTNDSFVVKLSLKMIIEELM